MKNTFLAIALTFCSLSAADDYSCRVTKPKKLEGSSLRIREEGKAYDVTLKSGDQEYITKGAIKIESGDAKKGKSVMFSGEGITLKLNPDTKTGGFVGSFRSVDGKKRRKSFSGEIQCD